MLLKIVHEKILVELPSSGKNNELRDTFQSALEKLKSSKEFIDGDASDNSKLVNADHFWYPFKLACETGSPKVVETTLDCVQKLIAHRHLRGALYDPKQNGFLVSEIIDVVSGCFVSGKTEAAVQLQVIKVLLTAITSPSCEVHDVALLKAVQTCFNIFLFSRSTVNQVTAKAALTQIVNQVFQRLEKHAVVIQQQQQSEKKVAASAPASPELNGAAGAAGVNGAAATSSDVGTSVQSSPSPLSPLKAPGSATDGTDGGDNAVEAAGAAKTPSPATVGDGQPGKYGFCIVCHKKADHYCSQTKDPVCSKECKMVNLERIEAEEKRRQEDINQAMNYLSVTTGDDSSQQPSPAAIVRDEKTGEVLNPYDVTSPSFTKILRKDVFLLFRRLCSLSKSPDETNQVLDQTSNELRGRILALELLLSVLTNPGPVFRTNDLYVSLVKKDLCLPLSKNGISSNPSLFDLSLSIFLMLLSHFKAPLKSEIQVLFRDIFLQILGAPSSSYHQKSMVMQALIKICSNAQTLVDLYLNYDCDVNGEDIFETTVKEVSRILTQSWGATDQTSLAEIRKIRLRGLQTLSAVVRSLVQWGTMSPEATANIDSVGAADDSGSVSANVFVPASAGGNNTSAGDSAFQEMKSRKTLLKQGIEKFNSSKPKKGLQFLQQNGFVNEDADAVAKFLLTTVGLGKASIGELLGDEDPNLIKIMHAFVDQFNFKNLTFNNALRHFLQAFRLPGESQKIDRLMEKFADRFCENNPDIFANADTAYTLAFSVIMLNTDLHSNQVKNKMTKQQFLRNNRGINNGGNLEDAFLDQIYDDISKDEIVMEEEQSAELVKAAAAGENLSTQQLQELHRMQVGQLTRKLQTLLQQQTSATVYHSGSHAEHVGPMFEVAWMPILAAFAVLFEESTDADTDMIALVLEGFTNAIHVAGQNMLATPLKSFIQSLYTFTVLSNVTQMRSKNIAAVHSLLGIAHQHRNALNESWAQVLECVSLIELVQAMGKTPIDAAATATTTTASSAGQSEEDKQKKKSVQEQTIMMISTIIQTAETSPQTKQQLDIIVREFQSQSMILAIDRIFSSSGGLTGQSIVHFFRCLCEVSREEVSLAKTPRLFSLQKVIELAYYNINRIRLEWSQIWNVLQPYFNVVGTHSNPTVATMAVDSLRQLAMKFLERDELGRFHTQGEFLKPIEHIMKWSQSQTIKEYALRSLEQMIQARSHHIKSGWKSIFVICGRASSEKTREMVSQAFSLLASIFTHHFEHASSAFVDFVNCLVDFTFNTVSEDIALASIHLLQSCAAQLTEAASIQPELPSPDSATTSNPALNASSSSSSILSVLSTTAVGPLSPSMQILQNAPNVLGKLDMDGFFLKWYPILSGLSRVVIDSPSLAIRKKALDTLFLLIRSSGRSYAQEYWRTVLRSVLHPIYEDLRDTESKKQELPSDLWVQALRSEVDLFTAFFSVLSAKPLLEMHLELLLTFMTQRNENLGKTGAICLHTLISKTLKVFTADDWKLITDLLELAFAKTTPIELMNPHRELDFGKAISKVAVHLELIKSLKDICTGETIQYVVQAPKESWTSWLQVLRNSYRFGRSFNSNYELRLSLMTAGFVNNVPNLNQQETLAAAAYLQFSFKLFAHFGCNSVFDDAVLFDECKALLDAFVAMLSEPKKNERDINARTHIIILIFDELTALDWSPSGKTRSLRNHLGDFFKFASQALLVETQPPRKAIQAFLDKVGSEIVQPHLKQHPAVSSDIQ